MRKMKILVTVALILTGINGYSQKLESGNVVSAHNVEITLDNGMTNAQVEKFIEDEYIPALEKNFPGVKMLMMKGERGERVEKYSYLMIFKSIDERNRWFPERGKMSEETKQALKNMQDLENKCNSMIKSISWTDFVIL